MPRRIELKYNKAGENCLRKYPSIVGKALSAKSFIRPLSYGLRHILTCSGLSSGSGYPAVSVSAVSGVKSTHERRSDRCAGEFSGSNVLLDARRRTHIRNLPEDGDADVPLLDR
jgi:hypothetical protein